MRYYASGCYNDKETFLPIFTGLRDYEVYAHHYHFVGLLKWEARRTQISSNSFPGYSSLRSSPALGLTFPDPLGWEKHCAPSHYLGAAFYKFSTIFTWIMLSSHSLLTWDSKECTGKDQITLKMETKMPASFKARTPLAITWRRSNLIFLCY